jgi:glyoxylase-like metal-dependent hydrolase (beta-lactamase superfamily II)
MDSSSETKVFHLNCGTMQPLGGRLLNRSPALVTCHCLLVETRGELLLVDAGVGLADMEDPKRLGPMRHLLKIRQDPAATAIRQLRGLGYEPGDVGHIVITHLDLDHSGGIPDFPDAKIHVLRPEFEAATQPATSAERQRYRRCHFAHSPKWVIHEQTSGEPWHGFECIREAEGLPPEIILVPLIGHTKGHCGVVVETPEGWLLHAGDAYYYDEQMAKPPRCPPMFKLFQYLAHTDRRKAQEQLEKLRRLANSSEAGGRVFCTHDPSEFEQLSSTTVS